MSGEWNAVQYDNRHFLIRKILHELKQRQERAAQLGYNVTKCRSTGGDSPVTQTEQLN